MSGPLGSAGVPIDVEGDKPHWLTKVASALGGPLGTLGAGLLSFFGSKDRNKQQMQLAREQMAFQERMSSTAYQRAAKDLEAAGLNRVLAFGKPASSPGGAMPQVENEVAQGMATAYQHRSQREQFNLMRKQGDQVAALARMANHQANSAYAQSELDRMKLEVYEKHPWLREFSAIAGAVAQGGHAGAGIAGTAQTLSRIFKGMK